MLCSLGYLLDSNTKRGREKKRFRVGRSPHCEQINYLKNIILCRINENVLANCQVPVLFQSKKKIYASRLTMVGGKVFSYPENFRLYKVKQMVIFLSKFYRIRVGNAHTMFLLQIRSRLLQNVKLLLDFCEKNKKSLASSEYTDIIQEKLKSQKLLFRTTYLKDVHISQISQLRSRIWNRNLYDNLRL